MGFRFRRFKVYHEIRRFTKDIYSLSSRFPKVEKYGLVDQIRRATTSIILNLAEGAGKSSDADFNRCVKISIGSVNEVAAILDICLDQKYINKKTHEEFLKRAENIVKQLYGLSRVLKGTKNSKPRI